MNVNSLGILIVVTGLAHSQINAPDKQEFEVASIKPNVSGSNSKGMFAQPGGRFGARNLSLRVLIGAAYNLHDFQISSGSSSPLDTGQYDIDAKAPAGTADGFEPLRPMLQQLLSQRFKLTFHRETKELPTYELVPTKGGPKITKPKNSTCAPPDPKNPRPREQTPFCDRIRTGPGLIEAYGITMPRLIAALSDVLGRVVIDQSGINNLFDAHLEFAPDEPIANSGLSTQAAPSIFTALKEQLGLDVKPSKGPVQVFVIDHAEKPSQN